MRMALVDMATRRVANVIRTTADDAMPDGFWVVPYPSDITAPLSRYEYTPEAGFYPDAEYQAELDAAAVAAEQEGLSETP